MLCAVLALAATLHLATLPAHCLHKAVAAPEFCHDLDCPTYVVEKTLSDDVEVRRYSAGELQPLTEMSALADVAHTKHEPAGLGENTAAARMPTERKHRACV